MKFDIYAMRKEIALSVIGLIIVGAGAYYLVKHPGFGRQSAAVIDATPTITIGDTKLKVRISDTPESRKEGLSGTESLPADEGMLYVFDAPKLSLMWARDMQYPVDYIWVGEDKKVARVESNVDPKTYPTIYNSRVPVKYTIEVNAGFAEAHGVSVGSEVTFNY